MQETANEERKPSSMRSHLKLCRTNDKTDKNFKRKNKQNKTKSSRRRRRRRRRRHRRLQFE